MKLIIKKISIYIFGLLLIWINFSFTNPLNENEEDLNKSKSPDISYFGKENITDGPYIFIKNNIKVVKWISKDRLKQKLILGDNYKVIKRNFGFDFQPEWIDNLEESKPDYVQKYEGVENFIAISDIHGRYDILVKLLSKHHVIDKDFNWSYGNGHLIILGDILDRGTQVTESLWLIFRLEQQAKQHGGKVHVLLGNHELMVLNNDSRYIHEKYIKSSELLFTTYSELFSEETLFGKWLKQKPVIVTINDIVFVHAGISTDFIKQGFTRTKTNKLFVENIVGKNWNEILADSSLSFMMDKTGPLWYRGYWEKPVIMEYQVDHLLRYFEVNHIIVGHTSFPNIVSLYDGKIFGIDSNIKIGGEYGELLIYKNESFYRGTADGSIKEFE